MSQWLRDFVLILLLPSIGFGLAWAAAFGIPLWLGPILILMGVGAMALGNKLFGWF